MRKEYCRHDAIEDYLREERRQEHLRKQMEMEEKVAFENYLDDRDPLRHLDPNDWH